MTNKHEKLLADFEIRMRQLMYLCDSLKEQNAVLRAELEQKGTEINSLNAEVNRLKLQYDNLKFAKSFQSGNSEEMQKAKQRLSRLVRDVDKCIALLKLQ